MQNRFWFRSLCLIVPVLLFIFKVTMFKSFVVTPFSWVDLVVPVVGYAGGCGAFLFTIFRYAVIGGAPLWFFVRHVPSLCGALSWHSSGVRVLIPLISMMLFGMHPVGYGALGYTLFWLVPLVIGLMRTESLWYNAVASTLVMHAVGSVIWLYTMPTSVEYWYALMPTVVIERTLSVLGMVMVVRGIQYVRIVAEKSLFLNRFSLKLAR